MNEVLTLGLAVAPELFSVCVCTPPLPIQTFILNQRSHSCALEETHSQTLWPSEALNLGYTLASLGDVWKLRCSRLNLRPAEIRISRAEA